MLAGEGSLREICLTLEAEVSLSVVSNGALDSEMFPWTSVLSGVAGE